MHSTRYRVFSIVGFRVKNKWKIAIVCILKKTDMNERCIAQKHRIILLTHWLAFFATLLQTVAATTKLWMPHGSASTAGFFCMLFLLLRLSKATEKKKIQTRDASIDWMHFTLHYYCYRKHANRITRYCDSNFYSCRVAYIAIVDVRVPSVCAAQTVDSFNKLACISRCNDEWPDSICASCYTRWRWCSRCQYSIIHNYL